jgi:probable rRNA maturation factor
MPVQSQIMIHHQYESLPSPTVALQKMGKKILKKETIPTERTVSVVLCSDYMIKKLNTTYRKKEKATDVLSFCFDDDDFLGEIYISLQRAKVQARRFGLTYEDEVMRLFVHGMIHLLGYDHIKEKDRTVMEAKEKQYFNVED